MRNIHLLVINQYEEKNSGGGVLIAFVLAFSVNALAQQNVSVQNQDNESITATLNCTDGGHMVTVGADSTVQENVGTVISITMYSQTLNFGQNGVITLPDNSTVNVAWSYNPGTSSVVLIVTSTAMGLVIPSHKDTLKSISHQGELASL